MHSIQSHLMKIRCLYEKHLKHFFSLSIKINSYMFILQTPILISLPGSKTTLLQLLHQISISLLFLTYNSFRFLSLFLCSIFPWSWPKGVALFYTSIHLTLCPILGVLLKVNIQRFDLYANASNRSYCDISVTQHTQNICKTLEKKSEFSCKWLLGRSSN